MPIATVDDEVITALRSGDQAAFAAVTERFRRQLHVHCYRMLGSFDEAEEIVQETFLRAWRGRREFEGRALLRSWLYRIATNACLDVIARRRPHRVVVGDDVTWLQPYPDRLLEPVAPSRDEPEEVASQPGDDRARLHRRHPVPPAAAACGADRSRHRRIAGQGDGGDARHERGVGEQRASARAGDAADRAPRTADGLDGRQRVHRRGARGPAAIHRRIGTSRPSVARGAAPRRRALRDAAPAGDLGRPGGAHRAVACRRSSGRGHSASSA